MAVLQNNILAGAAGQSGGAADAFEIKQSCRFNSSDQAYLRKDFGSSGNRKKWTWSGWVKRSKLGSSLMSRFFAAGSTSTSTGNVVAAFYQDKFFFQISSSSYRITSTRLFRDVSAWYHIVIAVDINLFTSSDRVKFM